MKDLKTRLQAPCVILHPGECVPLQRLERIRVVLLLQRHFSRVAPVS